METDFSGINRRNKIWLGKKAISSRNIRRDLQLTRKHKFSFKFCQYEIFVEKPAVFHIKSFSKTLRTNQREALIVEKQNL